MELRFPLVRRFLFSAACGFFVLPGAHAESTEPVDYTGQDVTPHSKWSYANDEKVDQEINIILDQTQAAITAEPASKSIVGDAKPPKLKDTWWHGRVGESLGLGGRRPVSLEELYVNALHHSTQLRVVSDVPLIRETLIEEAGGVFDTRGFVESAYDRINDPIRSVLDTGEVSGRFKQNEFRNQVGVRKKVVTGAEFQLSQEFGYIDNNSDFLVPNPQGLSRLKLRVTQPLLRGAGIGYNTAVIEVAKLDARSAYHEMVRQVEGHLLEVARSYWALYFARISYLRKHTYHDKTVGVAEELRARQDVDALADQIARADSAVAFRKSELARSQTTIQNAQDRLRSLISAPDSEFAVGEELIPADRMFASSFPHSYKSAAAMALKQRAEVLQGILQVKSSAVRAKVAKNRVLPQLNLILEGYVAGVDSGRDMGNAMGNQFSEGSPGGLVGLTLEFPFENRTAKAERMRRLIELRQGYNQLRTTIESVLLEVRISERELNTAWSDFCSKWQTVQAANADIEQLEARREVDTESPDGSPKNSGYTPSSYLDAWLNSLTRLEYAEAEFTKAAALYQVAIVNFERAQGNLVSYESVSIKRHRNDQGLPEVLLDKTAPGKSVRGFRK